MIKLDYEATKIGKGEYSVRCEGKAEGKRTNLIMEIKAALETFEDQMPKEFEIALDLFLTERGY